MKLLTDEMYVKMKGAFKEVMESNTPEKEYFQVFGDKLDALGFDDEVIDYGEALELMLHVFNLTV